MNNTPFVLTPPVVPLSHNAEPARGHGKGNMRVLLDPTPYPEVKRSNNERDNRDTVLMLKDDYAGAVSELTAITQYIFQNTTTKDETFSNAMLQIEIGRAHV